MRKRIDRRPRLPHEEQAAQLRFAKPQYQASADLQMDTTSLAYRKIHPTRDDAYLKWLGMRSCAIAGKINNRTGVLHTCWSPEWRLGGYFKSDAAHADASYSGRLKHNDTDCIPLCRHAHREETGNARRFDEDYGIDRIALAREYYARFKKERA